jgi:1,4-dihydroxy-2-naphthoyl-CoA hydrolase
LAFAEVLGGLGSSLLVDLDQYSVVGTQLSGNHVGMARKGMVTGEAHIVHQGRRTHVWNIDVKNEAGALVSSVRLTNLVIER